MSTDFTTGELLARIAALQVELEREKEQRQRLTQTLQQEQEASPYKQREATPGRHIDSAEVERDREKTQAERTSAFQELIARKQEEADGRPVEGFSGLPMTGPGTPYA